MAVKVGVICSGEGPELLALIEAVDRGRLPAEISLVVADRDGPALNMARSAGLDAVFLPRQVFHANRDGFERRLVEILRQAGAEAVVLAGFEREVGPVLEEAFPGLIYGQGLEARALAADLEKRLRGRLFQLLGD
ncbi:MAG: hypothetical protein LBP33_06525 [Candidatus Adiutrix sp.]|nr:hypothetical protein [Candidatus Adiutrix sp.]